MSRSRKEKYSSVRRGTIQYSRSCLTACLLKYKWTGASRRSSKLKPLSFIHIHQFQRQYEKFWEDPLGAPPLWVSMLFSLCCIAATISEATDSEPSIPEGQPSARASFLMAAAQCLVLGEFTRPQCLFWKPSLCTHNAGTCTALILLEISASS